VKTKFIIGGSFVSKFQPDQDPDFILPENVGSYAGRLNIVNESFNIFAEYAMKENDPALANGALVGGKRYYSYKDGDAIFLSASFAGKGVSLLLQGKRIDNMSYRSDRDATVSNLLINYLPATTKQHTYLLPAYSPYATQPTGEVGGMAELQFKLKKGTPLGGKYGTEVTINYSHANALKQRNVNDSTTTSKLYTTRYNEAGVDLYHDFFIEVNKKFSKQWKSTFMYCNQFNNINIVQHNTPKGPYGNVKSHIGVADITYKYASNSAIRLEGQLMMRDNSDTLNLGSWVVGLLEWTPNTNVFIALIDQYNYGNPVKPKSDLFANNKFNTDALGLHYFLVTAGYTNGPHRISVSYGKQRAGVFCVGGVCRVVPASNGVAISITSTF
jgi:hypothetical protein